MVGGRLVSTHDLFRRPLEHIVPPNPDRLSSHHLIPQLPME